LWVLGFGAISQTFDWNGRTDDGDAPQTRMCSLEATVTQAMTIVNGSFAQFQGDIT